MTDRTAHGAEHDRVLAAELQAEIEQVRQAIERVAAVEQARGALMAAFALSADDAGRALQHEVDHERIPLDAVADRVLAQITGRPAAPRPAAITPAGRSPRSPAPG